MKVNSKDLVFMIHRTDAMLRDCENKVFGEHGLTTEQYSVLTAIKYLDSPVRIVDVAHWLTRSTNSISMIADRMAKAGLLRRVRDRNDRRVVQLVVSSKAETLLKPATLAGQEFIQKMSQLSYKDQQILLGLLLTVQGEASAYLNGRQHTGKE